jgi:hypothetical protein
MKPIVRLIIFALCLISVAVLSRCGGGSQPPAPLTITTPSLPNGTLGALYSQSIQAGGGVAPFTWTVSSGTLPHNLALISSATNTVTISGTPDTTAQGVAFTLKVTDSANQSAAQAYTVSILLEPDTLTSSPASLSFAPQLVGTLSGAQAETITNTGTSAVVINSIAVTGTNALDFSQSSSCLSSLAAGANCTISVTFTASQLGPRSASIIITDNTVGSPHSVPLSGVGLTSGSNATLSAGSLTFGNQVVGTTSPTQSLALSNYGTKSLSIAGVAVTANFGEADTCSSSNLASGASCTINVTFTPSATGSLNGTLSVSDNAPGSPQTVSLSGTGVANNYTLTGRCVIQAGFRSCTQPSDPAQCPPGQTAISPTTLSGICFGSVTVDDARHCSSGGLGGVCGATSSSGRTGSGAASSGSLR